MGREILGLGVAPDHRRRGIGTALLAACIAAGPGDADHVAVVTLAERDPVDPLDVATRGRIARRVLEGAGFRLSPADPAIRAANPTAVTGHRAAAGVGS